RAGTEEEEEEESGWQFKKGQPYTSKRPNARGGGGRGEYSKRPKKTNHPCAIPSFHNRKKRKRQNHDVQVNTHSMMTPPSFVNQDKGKKSSAGRVLERYSK